MSILEQSITLKNSCALIGKAKDIFSPLKEAIINSLDAIAQRQKTNTNFTPAITVSVFYKTINDMFDNKTYLLDFISIEDNGIGFTSENSTRFKSLGYNTRGFNNRGTGKIQIFCSFEKITIDSTFFETSKWYKYYAKWRISGEHEEETKEVEAKKDTKTTVTMPSFSEDKKNQDFFYATLRILPN